MSANALLDHKKVVAIAEEPSCGTWEAPDPTDSANAIRILEGAQFPVAGEQLDEENYQGSAIDTNEPYEGKKLVDLAFSTYIEVSDEEITSSTDYAILTLLNAFLHDTGIHNAVDDRIEWTIANEFNEHSLSLIVYEDGVVKKYCGVRGRPAALKFVPGKYYIFDWVAKGLIYTPTTASFPAQSVWGSTKLQGLSTADVSPTNEHIEEWTLNFEGDLTDSPGGNAYGVDEIFLAKFKYMLALKTRIKAASAEIAYSIGDEMTLDLGSNTSVLPYFSFGLSSGSHLTGKVRKRDPLAETFKKMNTELTITNLQKFYLTFSTVTS